MNDILNNLSLDDFASVPDPIVETPRINAQFVVAKSREDAAWDKSNFNFKEVAQEMELSPVGSPRSRPAPAREYDVLSVGTRLGESVPNHGDEQAR